MFLCDKPVLTNQERGFLGDLITAPIDLADCIGKCVSSLNLIIASTTIYLFKMLSFSSLSAHWSSPNAPWSVGKGLLRNVDFLETLSQDRLTLPNALANV